MFTVNCVIKTDQILRFPHVPEETTKKKKKRNKKKRNQDEQRENSAAETSTNSVHEDDDDETFHPVMCTECNTEVGVYDRDEVYHFFNVLASHS